MKLSKEEEQLILERRKKPLKKKSPFFEILKIQFAKTMQSAKLTTEKVASTMPKDEDVLKGVMD